MERRRRITPRRLAGLLACAAVPALLATACSSGSGSSGDKSGSSTASASGSGGTSSTVASARFKNLPASCKTVTPGTVSVLVPKAKSPEGTETKSADISSRSGCSWTGNGKDGYQYRWLAVTLQRFDSSTALGSAEDQAKKRYADEVGRLGKVPGFTSTPVTRHRRPGRLGQRQGHRRRRSPRRTTRWWPVPATSW